MIKRWFGRRYTFRLWRTPDGEGEMLELVGQRHTVFSKILLAEHSVLVAEFEAATWEEACQKQYDINEWGTYNSGSNGWDPIETYLSEVEVQDSLPVTIQYTRGWRRRLFSWPWQPWRKTEMTVVGTLDVSITELSEDQLSVGGQLHVTRIEGGPDATERR